MCILYDHVYININVECGPCVGLYTYAIYDVYACTLGSYVRHDTRCCIVSLTNDNVMMMINVTIRITINRL